MKRALAAFALLFISTFANVIYAHPVPYSYIDIQLRQNTVEISLVVHIFDLAHELKVIPVERLLDPIELTERSDAIRRLISSRVAFEINGTPVKADWTAPEILSERQSIRLNFRNPVGSTIG